MIHVCKRPATSGAIGISLGFVFRLTWGILMVAGLLSFGFKWLSQLKRAWQMHSARSPHTSCSSVKGAHQPRGSDFQTRLDHERVLPKLQGFPRPPLASVARHGEAPVSRPAEADRLASADGTGTQSLHPSGGKCLA